MLMVGNFKSNTVHTNQCSSKGISSVIPYMLSNAQVKKKNLQCNTVMLTNAQVRESQV